MSALNDALRGESLSGLRNHSGWKVLVNEIIYPMYNDAFIILEDHNDEQARATIKALKAIMEKLDDSINLGVQARQEYEQTLAKSTQDTP